MRGGENRKQKGKPCPCVQTYTQSQGSMHTHSQTHKHMVHCTKPPQTPSPSLLFSVASFTARFHKRPRFRTSLTNTHTHTHKHTLTHTHNYRDDACRGFLSRKKDLCRIDALEGITTFISTKRNMLINTMPLEKNMKLPK